MMVSSSWSASAAVPKQAGDGRLDGGERRFDIVRQGIEERGFQDFALARRFGMAGIFQGARLLHRDGDQVDDGAQGLVGGQFAEQCHAAQAAGRRGGPARWQARRAASTETIVDFGGGEQIVIGHGAALGSGTKELLAGPVIEGRRVAARRP